MVLIDALDSRQFLLKCLSNSCGAPRKVVKVFFFIFFQLSSAYSLLHRYIEGHIAKASMNPMDAHRKLIR
jgi:hypothetical protein